MRFARCCRSCRRSCPRRSICSSAAIESKSIRESVHDVKFTLVLTVCLVVLVIFLFLRNVSATLIPSLALPASIVGTFGAMYLLGYSLDNLSLMALTLAVGFVVDDAIVMLENIVRHMEHGESAMEAALKGAQEVAFTIVSMTLSLVAVFIPVLFMGGIVGRLLHEFAVTISVAILISGFVSVSLTPMLCARWLRPGTHLRHGRDLHGDRAGVRMEPARLWQHAADDAAHHGRDAAVSFVLLGGDRLFVPGHSQGLHSDRRHRQHQRHDGIRAGHRLRRDGRAPEAGRRHHQGGSERARVHVERGQRAGRRRRHRPGPDEHRSQAVSRGRSADPQLGTADEVIAELRRKMAGVTGVRVFLSNPPAIRIGGQQSRSVYQYTLQSVDTAALYEFAPKLEQQMRGCPGSSTCRATCSSPTRR